MYAKRRVTHLLYMSNCSRLLAASATLRSLLPPPLLDDGGSVLTVGLEVEVEDGGGRGKSAGWLMGGRLRFFFKKPAIRVHEHVAARHPQPG
jgi:hypothetical protein